MTPEGKIKKKLDKLLKKYDVWYFKPQAGAFGRAGIPDYICCFYGTLIGIEAKADYTKKPTPLQLKAMASIEAHGGRAYVVCDDATLAHVEDVFKMMERGNS